MKRLILILLVIALVPLIMAASSTDYLLQRIAETHGEGIVEWGNTTPITIVTSITAGTNTAAFVDATEVMTLVGGGGAVASTQPMMNITVINAKAGTAVTGTITWSAGDLLTVEVNDADAAAQSKTTDCSGITLTACVTAANGFTYTEGHSTTAAAGASLPDTSFTDFYEPEAASDLAATAFTVAAGGSKVVTPIAMGDETLFDTAALDFTNKTLGFFETTMNALYGGAQITAVIAIGLDKNLANAMDSVDDVGATDYESALAMPFDAGTPPLDRLQEIRYTSIGRCVYTYEMGTGGFFEVYDDTTLIWKQVLVDGAANYTPLSFEPILSAKGANFLTVRLQGSDTVTAGALWCLGRTD